jgi:hypothetical protein
MDYGIYQLSGYCDHHILEDVRWASLTTPNGWCFYTQETNGDGHSFKRCSFGPSRAARFENAKGATIDDCIGGVWELQGCDGVEFRDHHLDPFVDEEMPAPMILIKDSRVRISGGFLLNPSSQPIIEVDDDEVNDATQLTVDGTSFGWRHGDPDVLPPRDAHIHIAAATARGRFIFHFPRGFTTRQGYGASDPVGVLVTSDDEGIQAAIDATPEQVNGHAELISENNEWQLRPVARVRTAHRWANRPTIDFVGPQLEIGGEIDKGEEYFYCIAVWDGFQWSQCSKDKSGKAEADETALILTINTRSANVKIRVWRGSAEGEYDRYIDLTVPTASTRLVDVGDYLTGLPWIAEGVPSSPETNSQRDLVEVAGHRLLWGSAAPTNGEWNRGDRVLHTEPSAGGNEGWVCVEPGEPGEPGTWKAFGAIAE